MFDEFLKKASELRSRGEAFATAMVVRYEAPISGKPGDKAIVLADGRIWGWIGGGCAQPLVVREALQALADGHPRLVRISPSPSTNALQGVVDYQMTCHSGGSLDIFIEPVLAKPHILILGRSAAAQKLARLAKAIDFHVSVAAPDADPENFPGVEEFRPQLDLGPIRVTPQTCVVIATQGESDEEAIELALTLGAHYVSFVASKTKAQKLFALLRERGPGSDLLDKIRVPAGLEIGAIAPEEIAVSILAEIVQTIRSRAPVPAVLPAAREQKDPVCGMAVEPGRARHKSLYQGVTYYFCCPHCREAFDHEPEKYLARPAASS
jgi:xanthine dehydrogenase accessory factor